MRGRHGNPVFVKCLQCGMVLRTYPSRQKSCGFSGYTFFDWVDLNQDLAGNRCYREGLERLI